MTIINILSGIFNIYFEEITVDRNNIIKWWKENSKRFPIPLLVAKRYIVVPDTQVTSKWLFSTTGNILTIIRKISFLLREFKIRSTQIYTFYFYGIFISLYVVKLAYKCILCIICAIRSCEYFLLNLLLVLILYSVNW